MERRNLVLIRDKNRVIVDLAVQKKNRLSLSGCWRIRGVGISGWFGSQPNIF